MKSTFVEVSKNFKDMATKAILSIVLFVFVYLTLFTLAVGLTTACTYGGIALIIFSPSFATLFIGLALISFGFLIFFFLVKFMFTVHKIDRSHLTEIRRDEEPKLFAFIDEVVKKVNTDFPKKVYLSADVNASVFYNSSFWSMFLPIKKNLQIGMGLVNTTSVTEFKAILAHEFGHFSQRTMKVGSYVYAVNQIIYNMLYENDSFENIATKLVNISGWFAFSVKLALKIIAGIQWILRKIYAIVNLNYLALSREMEFHADEVAAHVTGSQPLINSLLRLDLANHSFDSVLNYYNKKISVAVKTTNIYPQHRFVVNFLATESKLAIENNLPYVSAEHLNRYNKSKLVVKDQWASHPSTEDRVETLKKLAKPTESIDNNIAITLFQNIEERETIITSSLFENVSYEKEFRFLDIDEFIKDFKSEFYSNSFDVLYNGYYDSKNPKYDIVNDLTKTELLTNLPLASLFENNAVDNVYKLNSLENDIAILNQMKNGDLKIKTFDYDGEKFSIADCNYLLERLDKELIDLKEKIEIQDLHILKYFHSIAKENGKGEELLRLYKNFADFNIAYDEHIKLYTDISNELQFIHQVTPFEIIASNFENIKQNENSLKRIVKQLLDNATLEKEITAQVRKDLESYIAKEYIYFASNEYIDFNLNLLFISLQHFVDLLLISYFKEKQLLLNYQAKLVKENPNLHTSLESSSAT